MQFILSGTLVKQFFLQILRFLRADERCSDSYFGRNIFFVLFFRECFKICSGSSSSFCVLFFDLFLSSVHFLCYKESKLRYLTAKV